jgi:cytochrome c oxidase subunit 1
MENQAQSTGSSVQENDKAPHGNAGKTGGDLGSPQYDDKGIAGWITATDHKKIAVLFGVFALLHLVAGGVEGILIRAQLAHPEADIVSPRDYYQLFTMHGTMIFLAVIPLGTAFFIFAIPPQVGARNMAFPRINAFSFWCYLFGTAIFDASRLVPSGTPTGGWSGNIPFSLKIHYGDFGAGADFWIIGLLILNLSSLLASFNFITTIVNLRCPGMTMMRLPVFTWMALFTSILYVITFPVVSIALAELYLDRHFGTHFFSTLPGGKTILWQHFFWMSGHPELYILILPGIGIISEILPTFSRNPLRGYSLVIFSVALLGFLGISSWNQGMSTAGIGDVAKKGLSIVAMLTTIPTGLILTSWLLTLRGGGIRFKTPMLFALGFIAIFIFGWITSIMHATAAVDAQLHDSYFEVAHLHYLLVGGSLFAILAGFYFWIPKLTGAMMDEWFGKLCFLFIFTGFNITFFPMHYLGLEEMPRRVHTYKPAIGWDEPNSITSLGALILGFGVLFSIIQVAYTTINKKKLPRAGNDPWRAGTLEWTTPSPMPAYNFIQIPEVSSRTPNNGGDAGSTATGHTETFFLPNRSWNPFFTGAGVFILASGFLSWNVHWHFPGEGTWEPALALLAIGFTIIFMCIVFWGIESPGNNNFHPSQVHPNHPDPE